MMMGQMQRRKRKFRESMRSGGEPIPSLRQAARRLWSLQVRMEAEVVAGIMALLSTYARVRLAISGQPQEIAYLGGETIMVNVSPECAEDRASRTRALIAALTNSTEGTGIKVDLVY